MKHIVIYSTDGETWCVLFDDYESQPLALADMREQARLHPENRYEYHAVNLRVWSARTPIRTFAFS